MGENGDGDLSRSTAWRTGSYWEDMGGDAKVSLEKDVERNEVNVEKLVWKGRTKNLFKELKPGLPRQQPDGEGGDESAAEMVDSPQQKKVTKRPRKIQSPPCVKMAAKRGKRPIKCG